MRPIVDGIKDSYTDQLTVRILDARDGGEGERLFGELALPGHPAIVLVAADGVEVYRGVGLIEEALVLAQLGAVGVTQ